MPADVPPAGLRGTHEGSCVVCLRPTDTGLGFRGPVKWPVAALDVAWGIPAEQTAGMIADAFGLPRGELPAGVHDFTFRVCGDCAARARPHPLRVGLLARGQGIPIYPAPEPGRG